MAMLYGIASHLKRSVFMMKFRMSTSTRAIEAGSVFGCSEASMASGCEEETLMANMMVIVVGILSQISLTEVINTY